MHIAQTGSQAKETQTVVVAGPYKGLVGTMRSIIYEEGERTITAAPVKAGATSRTTSLARDPERKKGQGLEGLWRGWRVGMWGLIGVWGAAAMGGAGSKGGEF